jgi:hypothetical protein
LEASDDEPAPVFRKCVAEGTRVGAGTIAGYLRRALLKESNYTALAQGSMVQEWLRCLQAMIRTAKEGKWDRERRWGPGSWRLGQSREGEELMGWRI